MDEKQIIRILGPAKSAQLLIGATAATIDAAQGDDGLWACTIAQHSGDFVFHADRSVVVVGGWQDRHLLLARRSHS